MVVSVQNVSGPLSPTAEQFLNSVVIRRPCAIYSSGVLLLARVSAVVIPAVVIEPSTCKLSRTRVFRPMSSQPGSSATLPIAAPRFLRNDSSTLFVGKR